MGAKNMTPEQQERPRRNLADVRDRLILALEGMTLNPNQGLMQVAASGLKERAEGRQAAAKEKEAQAQTNRTLQYLQSVNPAAAAYFEATGDLKGARDMMQAKGPDLSEKEKQIARLAQLYDYDTAVRIADGVYTVSRDPFTDNVQVIDKATGQPVNVSPQTAPPAQQSPAQDAAPTGPALTFGNVPTGGEAAFGIPGMAAGAVNAITDALGAGEVFPEVAEQQRFFRAFEEDMLVGLSQAYGRMPAQALMERLRALAPQVGTLEGAGRAKGELQQLRGRFAGDLASRQQSLKRRLSPEARAELESQIAGLESTLRYVDEAIVRLGGGTGGTSGKTSSGVTWSVE
jgi:hypothetical protein